MATLTHRFPGIFRSAIVLLFVVSLTAHAEEKKPSGCGWRVWLIGGAVVAAGVVGAYLWFSEVPGGPKPVDIKLNNPQGLPKPEEVPNPERP